MTYLQQDFGSEACASLLQERFLRGKKNTAHELWLHSLGCKVTLAASGISAPRGDAAQCWKWEMSVRGL